MQQLTVLGAVQPAARGSIAEILLNINCGQNWGKPYLVRHVVG